MTKHEQLHKLEQTVAKRRLKLSDEQIRLLEKFSPEFRERHIETRHTGDLVAVDTFFVGTLKGIGRIYLQSVIDCLGAALYQQTAGNGREYCGRPDRHPYELFLQLEASNIAPTRSDALRAMALSNGCTARS